MNEKSEILQCGITILSKSSCISLWPDENHPPVGFTGIGSPSGPGNVGGQKKVNGSLEETLSSSKFIGLVGFFLNGFGKATNFPSVPNHLEDL